jgi:hypothetical protein
MLKEYGSINKKILITPLCKILTVGQDQDGQVITSYEQATICLNCNLIK